MEAYHLVADSQLRRECDTFQQSAVDFLNISQ